jgi:hypothetical protein
MIELLRITSTGRTIRGYAMWNFRVYPPTLDVPKWYNCKEEDIDDALRYKKEA